MHRLILGGGVSAHATMTESMSIEDQPLASFAGIARADADRRHDGPQKGACEAELMRVFGARALVGNRLADRMAAPRTTSAPKAVLRSPIKALATDGPADLHRTAAAVKMRDPQPAPPATDRRAGADRRLVDVPLPIGRRDRCHALEARKPDVVGINMSHV